MSPRLFTLPPAPVATDTSMFNANTSQQMPVISANVPKPFIGYPEIEFALYHAWRVATIGGLVGLECPFWKR